MKKLIAILILGMAMAATGMEQKEKSGIKKIMVEPLSLKFNVACQLVNQDITIDESKIPEEVLEYINQIKYVQSRKGLTRHQKKLFLNLINNPEVDVRLFKGLIMRYLPNKASSEINKQILLDAMLIYAAGKGKITLIKLLLKFGADINAQNEAGESAITQAAEEGRTEIVDMLLDLGAEDIMRLRPLGMSARKYSKRIQGGLQEYFEKDLGCNQN